jgi:[acyl-carrier-protein] S-malonyltransferase
MVVQGARMSLAFVFPGQGSQSVGMLADFHVANPLGAELPAAAMRAVSDTFQQASEAIQLDLWQLAQSGPDVELSRTENTQPALLAASVALFRAWIASGGAMPELLAGHSLGEYSALVCSETMSLSDATRLVRLRGQLMQAAVPLGVGAMAAVLGGDLTLIEQACLDAAEGEIIEPANLNAPGQIVISGHASALDRTLKLLAERGVRKAIRLPVSVPSHCALMREAAVKLGAALAEIELRAPKIPLLHNVSATVCSTPDAIRAALVAQLYSRVRWIESVQALSTLGATRVLECGPGKALSGMIKRIAPELSCAGMASAVEFNDALLNK